MLPVAPLMIEHRLIERMIAVLRVEVDRVKKTSTPDAVAIDRIVDFIRTYADQTHHGKEEDILFRELQKKEQSDEDRRMMEDLIADHVKSRETTKALVAAKECYLKGDDGAVAEIASRMEFLAGFYPVHIEKEDKHYFIPAMKYFTKEEQEALLREGREFDRKMIHRKYEQLVMENEATAHVVPKKMDPNWMDFL
ncbi:MAG: hemerythrin domain-containing protein [Candidatus Lokiarchaeota archaeon]|nr:hemerythrin domain-containing protein [Candidatus Lokiarchaeota archaeon]